MNYSFFQKNAEKVRIEMRKQGIDVMILTHQQKYSYVAGTYHNDFNLGNCLFLWANQEPTLLVALAEVLRLKYEGYITDVRSWIPALGGATPKSFNDCALEILREHECEKAVIAVEGPSIQWQFYSFLEKNLPNATLIDGEKMINQVMMIKDEEELEIMRRVVAISDAGTRMILENAHVGITEAELVGYAEKEMRRLGTTWYYTPNQCLFHSAHAYGDHLPTNDHVLCPGDKILFDLHPVWHEYRSDSARVVAFGQPSKEYMKMMDVLRKVIPKLNAQFVPGASTVEIDKWFRSQLKEGGYPADQPNPFVLGHGIGTGHLPPTFHDDDDCILQENTIIVPCALIFNAETGDIYAQEYIVCVKPGKPEILTKYPIDLIII